MKTHPRSDACPCLDCVTPDDKICVKTIGCTLRPSHAGPCMGALGYVGFALRTVAKEYRAWFARKLRRKP